METQRLTVNNTLIQMLLVVKLQQLQRESLPGLTYQQLESFTDECIIKKCKKISLHNITDLIMTVQGKDIVKYLSRKAIIDSRTQSLSDFSDVIGGE